jgi:pyruvate kinase
VEVGGVVGKTSGWLAGWLVGRSHTDTAVLVSFSGFSHTLTHTRTHTSPTVLESMIHNPRPTRAECSDVANAVLDGTDCVMLSGETANGPYFEQAIQVMSRTCVEAEDSRNYNALYSAIRNSVIKRYGSLTSIESLASSAVKTAIDVNAALIVVLSESGQTARYVAKFCPGIAIICLTPNATVARQAAGLYRGVHAYIVNDLAQDVELTRETGAEAVKVGVAQPGQLMVVVSGTLQGKGQNNQIRVESIVAENPEHASALRRLHSFAVDGALATVAVAEE